MNKILKIFLLILFTSELLSAQTVDIPLIMSDGTSIGNDTLRFGLDPTATDGIDTALGEYQLPPMPPTGIFDARFIGNDLTPPLPLGQGVNRDYREGSGTFVGTKIHELKFQRGTGTSITISWNLPEGITGRLYDLLGGIVVNDSMYNTGSTVVTNAAITSLFMRINYGTASPPNTPVLISPTNEDTVSTTPLLNWEDVQTATSYRLQVSEVANFSTTVIDEVSLTQSQYQISSGTLSNETQYFWRVRARNSAGWSPWVSAWSFYTLSSPPPPEYTYPPCGATNISLTPLLNWSDVPTAISYGLQLSEVPSFTTTIVNEDSLTQSQYQVMSGVLSYDTQYYWRVRAKNTVGWSPWATLCDFTTISQSPPTTPILLSPANGSTVSTTPLLDWNDVPSATSYRLQVSEVANFMTTVIDEVSLTQSQYQVPDGILSTDVQISGNVISKDEREINGVLSIEGIQYYWRVRARNSTGWSPWASAWNFTTALFAPTTPVLLSPANGSTVTTTPLLDWNDVSSATSYRLQVSEVANFMTTVIDEISLTQSRYQVPGGILSISVQYYWRVRARNSVGWSPWASAWNFTTAMLPPVTPVLKSPANGSTVSTTPLLDWYDVPHATNYRLQVSEVANFSTTIIDDSSLTQSKYQVPNGLLSITKQYYWRISAKNIAGSSSWTSAWNFTTALFAPTTPVLLSPANGSTVSATLLLDWNDVPSATSYRLQISEVENFMTTVIDEISLTQSQYQVPDGILSTDVQISSNVMSKDEREINGVLSIEGVQYYWRVRARNSVGWSPWASAWNFTTAIFAPTTPVLLSPANGSTVTTTPLLDWNDVSSATSYRLQVSEVANFMTTVIDEISLTQSRYQVPGGILSISVQYYWRVRARNSAGWSPWASAWNFTTAMLPPVTPVLKSPANGSMVSTTPLLDWYDVPHATSYRLQVSEVANFMTTVIDEVSLTQSQYQVPEGILSIEDQISIKQTSDDKKTVEGILSTDGVQYYWRVRARNSVGWSPWASAWNFMTALFPPTTPILLSPSNGSTVSTTPLLDWNDVSTATSYRLQISEVPTFMTTVIDKVSLAQSQYQVPSGILSSNIQYYWRTRARNSAGWSPWASAWNFTTQVTESMITGINIYSPELPTEFKLYQNYPNPFNPKTNIRFDLVTTTKVELKVYDILGREVQTLINNKLKAGKYEYLYSAINLSSGVYLYRLEAGEYTMIKKMVVLN